MGGTIFYIIDHWLSQPTYCIFLFGINHAFIMGFILNAGFEQQPVNY